VGLLKKGSNALRHRNLMLSRVVWDAPFLAFSTAPLSPVSPTEVGSWLVTSLRPNGRPLHLDHADEFLDIAAFASEQK